MSTLRGRNGVRHKAYRRFARRKRAAADEWVEAFCDLALAWRPNGWAEGRGQIRSGVGPFLEKRMRERNAFAAPQQFAAPRRSERFSLASALDLASYQC